MKMNATQIERLQTFARLMAVEVATPTRYTPEQQSYNQRALDEAKLNIIEAAKAEEE